MRKLFVLCTAVIFIAGFSATAFSATLDEAKALVEKAAAYYEANGKEKAIKEYNNPKGQFVNGELYVFAWDMNGTNIAHPINPKQIGVNVIELPDVDGKFFRKEAMETVKKSGTATVDYKFKNPATGKVEPKVTYFKKVGDVVLGCGAYR
jgi:signal transduction histidine kinase